MNLLDELQSRILCGDGAIGTLLLEGGVPFERCLEEINVTEPERIHAIHQQYIAAGARVIKTNTFGANAVRLERFGFENRVAEINCAAAQITSAAARGKNVFVAGSVGPLGINSDEANARGINQEDCFREQILGLLEGGVQIIFFETFTDYAEMEIAVKTKKEITDSLAICSFACAPEGRISSAMPLVDAIAKLRELGVEMVGANCTNGPNEMMHLLQRLPADYILAAYPNAGYPQYHEGRFIYHMGPDYFAQSARGMVAEGAHLIGGCCGTTPAHVAAISSAVAELQPMRTNFLRYNNR